jgi:hypothetical protein
MISISPMWALFHSGSSTRFASRVPSRACTVVIARKWSTRKICCSSKAPASNWFKLAAELRSSPNGFSSTSRLPGGSPAWRTALIAAGKTDGGSAR